MTKEENSNIIEITTIGDEKRSYLKNYDAKMFTSEINDQYYENDPSDSPETITSNQIHIINQYLVGNTKNWWVHLIKYVGHALGIKIYNIQELTRKQADTVISYCRNYSHHYQEDRAVVQDSNEIQSNNQNSCIDIWEDL